MALIIQFRPRPEPLPDSAEEAIPDLLTAVDVAIRDLADIVRHDSLDAVREQAEDCRRMLLQAFEHARA